jgi:hypothetical protein
MPRQKIGSDASMATSDPDGWDYGAALLVAMIAADA